MVNYRLLTFILIFSAVYFVVIAFIYTSVQFFHFRKEFITLNQNIDRIDILLNLSNTKLSIIEQKFTQTKYDIIKNLSRLKSIFNLLYPLVHGLKVDNKMKKMDKKMNKILKKLG